MVVACRCCCSMMPVDDAMLASAARCYSCLTGFHLAPLASSRRQHSSEKSARQLNDRNSSTIETRLPRPPPSTMTTPRITETYEAVESRIQQAIDALIDRGYDNSECKPKYAAAAREFNVPVQRLKARWNGRQSK